MSGRDDALEKMRADKGTLAQWEDKMSEVMAFVCTCIIMEDYQALADVFQTW